MASHTGWTANGTLAALAQQQRSWPQVQCRTLPALPANTQSPASPETADAAMAAEDASNLVSVLSSPSKPSTLPSSALPEEADSPMGEGDCEGTSSSTGAGDCLSNCPASSNMPPANEVMAEEDGEESSALPPQGVDPIDDSSPSHISESPIKRRPGTKASPEKAQSKKLRQSVGQAPKQPIGSIPEHGPQPVTLADLADMNAPIYARDTSPSEPGHAI